MALDTPKHFSDESIDAMLLTLDQHSSSLAALLDQTHGAGKRAGTAAAETIVSTPSSQTYSTTSDNDLHVDIPRMKQDALTRTCCAVEAEINARLSAEVTHSCS